MAVRDWHEICLLLLIMSLPPAATAAKVLVIDDDKDLRYSLRRALAGLGHQVLEADSGETGVALAKREPGKMNYASSGPGTPYHMAGELFKSLAGIDVVHIPHKGSDQARLSILSGQVQMMIEVAAGMGLIHGGHAVAHGHSIHSFRGDLQRAQAEEARLQALACIPFVTPSIAVLEGLKAIGNPKRIGVLTPYWPPADAIIAEFFTACGFEVVASHGLKSTGPISVAQFTPEQIMQGFEALDKPQVQALVHVGTNLPVSAMTPAIEAHFGKPLIGVNVATYWLALRRLGLRDAMPGFGILAEQH